MKGVAISDTSLLLASSLVLVSLLFSYFQKLKLEKETLISVIRAVIQLFAVGYILQFIFGLHNAAVTTLILLLMIFNASYNAAKRGKKIKNGILISYLSILIGAGTTLSVLLLSGAIQYEAYQIIPISGMIISNAMVAIGLCYRQLSSNFKSRRNEVEAKLSLGADILPASMDILRDSIRTGMVPTIDSTKTLGIVSLPGMMTGLILAGTSPLTAIRYQIMVTFMLLSTTAISSFLACFLSYRGFFNKRKQLR
jgi:putative ABC transport system permease protein